MEIRVLNIFRCIARQGSLARAAREVHLTPSALSHALKALETELGCRLFERTGNQLVLNHAGEQFLAEIDPPLKAIDHAAAAVRDLTRWGQGRVRIGAPASACQALIPPVLGSLRKEYPRIQIVVESGDMPSLVEQLRERTIDLALGVEPEAASDLEYRALFEDELFFTLSPGHPWNRNGFPSPDEVRRETLIVYQRMGPTARLFQAYCRESDYEPATTMAIASIAAIKEMVRLNLGVGVLAPWVAESELTRGSLRMRPLGPRALRRRWVIAHLAGRTLTLGEETFCRLCRAQGTALRKVRKDLPSGTLPDH